MKASNISEIKSIFVMIVLMERRKKSKRAQPLKISPEQVKAIKVKARRAIL